MKKKNHGFIQKIFLDQNFKSEEEFYKDIEQDSNCIVLRLMLVLGICALLQYVFIAIFDFANISFIDYFPYVLVFYGFLFIVIYFIFRFGKFNLSQPWIKYLLIGLIASCCIIAYVFDSQDYVDVQLLILPLLISLVYIDKKLTIVFTSIHVGLIIFGLILNFVFRVIVNTQIEYGIHTRYFTLVVVSALTLYTLFTVLNRLYTLYKLRTNYLKAQSEQKILKKELDAAYEIQQNMLPKLDSIKDNEAIGIYGISKPALYVGGDFYNFFYLDDTRIALMIADVSGKGIPAAMFMVKTKTILEQTLRSEESLVQAIHTANIKLCNDNESMYFATAWVGVFDCKTGILTYCNAGHEAPLISRQEKFSWLDVDTGFVLGGFEDLTFIEQKIRIDTGDKIILYTDGVTEAENVDGIMYGKDRFINCANDNKCFSAKDYIDVIVKNVEDFVGGAEQSDDLTMLAFEFKNTSKK